MMWSGTNSYPTSLTPMKKNKTENSIDQFKNFFLTSPSVLWLLLFIITLAFTVTHYPGQSNPSYSYNIGDVAKRDIKAPKNFFVEDKAATNQKKNKAGDPIRPDNIIVPALWARKSAKF